MCVICHFHPGYTPPYSYIETAAHNNPHGFGIVIKRDNEPLQIIRELSEGGNKPEDIYKILKDNEDTERFLHVRWKTIGDISLDNVQPFIVYTTDKRQIAFMHNGTLSTGNAYQHNVPTKTVDSDSKQFAQNVLSRYLPKLVGDNGIADIEDDDIRDMLEKHWSGGITNRGILICNDLDPYYFNLTSWKKINTKEIIDGKEVSGQFLASNDEYFDRVKRGPLFEKMEQERKKADAEAKERAKQEGSQEWSLDSSLLGSHFFRNRHSLSLKLIEIMEDVDFFTPEGYCSLANLTYAEALTMLENMSKDDRTALVMYLAYYLKENTERLIENVDQLTKAKSLLDELPQEIIQLRQAVGYKRARGMRPGPVHRKGSESASSEVVVPPSEG